MTDTPQAARFEPFGSQHFIGLAVVLAIALGLSAAARRSRGGRGLAERAIRLGLAGFLLLGLAASIANSWSIQPGDWIDMLPLHLCDMSIFIAMWTLTCRSQTGYELLYFWALAGTLFALITPDIQRAFPDFECVSFFALHGAVVASAIVLTFGCGLRPRPGAHVRVWLLTNAYAVLVWLVDAASGRNYLYLRHKPLQPSILDVMGSWPWYIVVADVFAFALFAALMLPFAARRRSAAVESAR